VKRILFLFLILIALSGCKTIEYVEVPVVVKPNLEPPPQREILDPIQENEDLYQFMLRRINYFSELVNEWESWGISVYESVDVPVPEGLLLPEKDGEK